MKKYRIRWAIREIARRNRTTEKQVVAQIEEAIAEAIHNAKENDDQLVLARWEKIPHRGETVTAQELMCYLADRLRDAQ